LPGIAFFNQILHEDFLAANISWPTKMVQGWQPVDWETCFPIAPQYKIHPQEVARFAVAIYFVGKHCKETGTHILENR